MPVTLGGHRRVTVEKDDVHCKWLIKSPQGDVIYEVSWRYAFEHQNVSDEYYDAIYTALCYAPLSDADKQALLVKFPSLQLDDEMEVEVFDRISVQSPRTPPPAEPQPKAKEQGKKSFKRKVDL